MRQEQERNKPPQMQGKKNLKKSWRFLEIGLTYTPQGHYVGVIEQTGSHKGEKNEQRTP